MEGWPQVGGWLFNRIDPLDLFFSFYNGYIEKCIILMLDGSYLILVSYLNILVAAVL